MWTTPWIACGSDVERRSGHPGSVAGGPTSSTSNVYNPRRGELSAFVDGEIDPVCSGKTYRLEPDAQGERPYALRLEARARRDLAGARLNYPDFTIRTAPEIPAR